MFQTGQVNDCIETSRRDQSAASEEISGSFRAQKKAPLKWCLSHKTPQSPNLFPPSRSKA